MTFKERFFLGEIPFEDIDRYTSRWNFSDETCTLAAYLGLNGEEEDVWISQSDEALEALVMLGFARGVAEKAVRAVVRESPSAPVEEVVRMALKRL